MYAFRFVLALVMGASATLGVPMVAANAQAPPISGMQQVSGKYTDPSVGLQITFPDGWSGFQIPNAGTSMAMASPGGVATTTGQSDNAVMFVFVTIKKPINATFQNPTPNGTTSQPSDCTTGSVQKTTVNGMNAVQITGECTGSNPFKGKGYVFQTADKNIIVMFGSSSSSNFDKYVGQFDSSMNTLQIANTVDVTAVPEFPLAGVAGIAAIVGVIAILGRTKIFSMFRS